MTTPSATLRRLLGTVTVLGFLVLWEVLGRTDALGNHVLPPFSDTFEALTTTARGTEFWTAIGDTMAQWAVGLAGAVVVAIPLGLLLGSGPIRRRSTRTTIDFLRTIPPVMLLPLFVLIWGTGLNMVVFLAIYAAVWPMLTQTITGVSQIEEQTLDTVTVFRIGPWRRFTQVLLPAVSPFITSGVRISAIISLFIAVVCELVAGSPGLGALLARAQLGGDSPLMFALILVTGVIGVLINVTFQAAESRLLAWHPAYAKGNAS